MTAVRTEVGHWALVPSWVRKALRGQSRALELYVLFADIANHDDNVAQRRRGWLAKELDCSPDTVDRALAVLVRVGAVSIERRYDGDGANLPSNYLVHQVQPPAANEEGSRVDAARDTAEEPPEASLGDGRVDAARGPHGRGEVAAPMPRRRRADAAVSNQPPNNQPPSNHQENPDVASDDGAPPEQGTDSLGRGLTRQQILWATIAVAFDWDPRLQDPDQLKQVKACAGKLATRNVSGDDLDEVRAVAWFARGKEPGVTPAAFGERWGRFRGDAPAEVLAHREEGAEIVTAASVALSRPLVGTDRVQAEYAVAVLLARGKTRALVKRAIQRQGTDPWTINYLEHAATQVEKELGNPRRGLSTAVPDDLADLSDRQLVDLLRSEPSGGDVDRIGTEIKGRILVAGPDQYRRAVEVRGLVGGKEGWPRGMGDVNKLRMELGVTLDQWLAANAPNAPTAQHALSRGA